MPRARKIRIEYAGAVYHVMAGGNQERTICGDERDRKLRYLSPTNQGVAGSLPFTVDPLAERGKENLATR